MEFDAGSCEREGDVSEVSKTVLSDRPGFLILKGMASRRIQEQGLRTYLFTYAPHYSTLSLSLLSRTFSLPLRTVTSTVSKMIWNEELSASLDQSGGVIVFHRIEVSRQQQLALMIAEKINAIADQNEKNLDNKMGGGANWGDRTDGKQGEKRGEQTQERRGKREGTRGARGWFIHSSLEGFPYF